MLHFRKTELTVSIFGPFTIYIVENVWKYFGAPPCGFARQGGVEVNNLCWYRSTASGVHTGVLPAVVNTHTHTCWRLACTICHHCSVREINVAMGVTHLWWIQTKKMCPSQILRHIRQLWTQATFNKWHKRWRYQWLHLYKLGLRNQALCKRHLTCSSIAFAELSPITHIFSWKTERSDVFVLYETSLSKWNCQTLIHVCFILGRLVVMIEDEVEGRNHLKRNYCRLAGRTWTKVSSVKSFLCLTTFCCSIQSHYLHCCYKVWKSLIIITKCK